MEALQIMVATGKRPPVCRWSVAGIVAMSDLMDAVAASVCCRGGVRFQSARSLSFYQQLLTYPIRLTLTPHCLLDRMDPSSPTPSRDISAPGFGAVVAWTAGGARPGPVHRVLKELAPVSRDTSERITLLEGCDPDGLPVIIVTGAEHVRHLIHARITGPMRCESKLTRVGRPRASSLRAPLTFEERR
jgi:hypothetical protein